MGNVFQKKNKDTPSNEEQKIKQIQKDENDRKYWKYIFDKNTEWIVSELLTFWDEGMRHGKLSVRDCYQKERIKKIMKDEHDIFVTFTEYHRTGDMYGRDDKIFFIMRSSNPIPLE